MRERLSHPDSILHGDALKIAELSLPRLDFVMTSPPYMNEFDHPQNPLTGYTSLDGDYVRYLRELKSVFAALAPLLKPGGHAVVNVADIRSGERITHLASDLKRELAGVMNLVEEVRVRGSGPPTLRSRQTTAWCFRLGRDACSLVVGRQRDQPRQWPAVAERERAKPLAHPTISGGVRMQAVWQVRHIVSSEQLAAVEQVQVGVAGRLAALDDVLDELADTADRQRAEREVGRPVDDRGAPIARDRRPRMIFGDG